MPDDSFYTLARQSRKEPKNKSRIVIESPGVRDETEKKTPKVTLGQGMHQVEPGDEGTGAYSDRIKIKPKFQGESHPPLPSDSEIQKLTRSQETQI